MLLPGGGREYLRFVKPWVAIMGLLSLRPVFTSSTQSSSGTLSSVLSRTGGQPTITDVSVKYLCKPLMFV